MFLKKMFNFIKFINDFCKVKTVFDSECQYILSIWLNGNFTFKEYIIQCLHDVNLVNYLYRYCLSISSRMVSIERC